jgi:hypothetical protein
MYKAPSIADPQKARMDSLRTRLRSLDLRIKRMRELHAGTSDPLAKRLIEHSLLERREVLAKLPAQ